VPRATRTPRKVGICPSFKDHSLARAKPVTGQTLYDSLLFLIAVPRAHRVSPSALPPPHSTLRNALHFFSPATRGRLERLSTRETGVEEVWLFPMRGGKRFLNRRAWRRSVGRRSLPHTGRPLPGGSCPPAVGRERSARLRQVQHALCCAQGPPTLRLLHFFSPATRGRLEKRL
jgi:hypothetical protein